jgi:very-short-patch-repair endonuclease
MPLNVDLVARAIARRQNDLVSRRQLLAAEVSHKAIVHRVKTGRFVQVFPGVYLVGPSSPDRIHLLNAAVLFGPPQAYLSDHSALELDGIAKSRPGPIHVTAPTKFDGTAGIEPHRTTLHHERFIGHRRGMRVASPALALLQLAASQDKDLPHLVAEALALKKTTTTHITTLIAAFPTHRGTPAMRRLLATDAKEIARMRSEAERIFWRLIKRSGLPLPEANAQIEGREVDFAWRDHRVAVEIDGFAFHSTRPKRRNDRAKDDVLRAAGWQPIRLDYEDLTEAPEAALVQITRALLIPA